jgi:hypothetical protein
MFLNFFSVVGNPCRSFSMGMFTLLLASFIVNVPSAQFFVTFSVFEVYVSSFLAIEHLHDQISQVL